MTCGPTLLTMPEKNAPPCTSPLPRRRITTPESESCVPSTACASRPATSATTRRERVLSAINPCGVTALIVVMRWATCRPFRPRVPRCRGPHSYHLPRLPQAPKRSRSGVSVHHAESDSHAARDQYPGPLGAGYHIRAQGDRDALLSHAEKVGQSATRHH